MTETWLLPLDDPRRLAANEAQLKALREMERLAKLQH